MQPGATTLGARQKCEDCGGEKPRGRGYRVCEGCKVKRLEAERVRRNETKRHPCQRCKKPKEVGNISIYCLECSEWAKTKPCSKCGGELKGGNHCARCERSQCPKCGGEKPAGYGRHYCEECQELESWRNKLRVKNQKRVQRWCIDCGTLIRGEGLRYCDKCKARRETRWCIKCKVKPARAKVKKYCDTCYAESLIHIKEYHKAYQRNRWKTDEEWRKRQLSRGEKYRKNLTKAGRQYLNESGRMRHRLKNGDARVISLEAYRKRNGGKRRSERVDVTPLLPFLREAVPEESLINADGKLRDLAKLTEVDASHIGHCLKGTQTTLRLADADSLCIAMGLTLYEVYGFDIHVVRGATLDTPQ